jgi:hypothetical protein
MPEAIIASAVWEISCSLMPQPNRYQGFQPIGGVSDAPAAPAPLWDAPAADAAAGIAPAANAAAGDATVAHPAAGNVTAMTTSAAHSFETIRTGSCNSGVRTMTRSASAL